MAELRVLVVGLPADPESFVLRTLAGLTRSGAEVSVASRRPVDGLADLDLRWVPDPLSGPADVVATWRSRRGRGVDQLRRLSGAREFETKQVRAGFDVIYLPWINTAADRPRLFELGVPVAVSCRGSLLAVAPWNPRRRELRDALPTVLRRAAAVHCVSASMEREARAHGLEPGRGSVIYTGVDTDRYRPGDDGSGASRRAPRELRVLWVGGLNWKKDVEHAILAIGELRSSGRDCSLSVVGTGPELDRARFTRRDLGLDGDVRFLGHVGQEELPAMHRCHDALLHTSSTEGVPNVVVEAMASSLPVVATDAGGTAEAVTDGVEGFLVPPRSVARMSEQLGRLADDPEARRVMGRAGRRRAVAQFDLRSHVAGFTAFLEAAAGRSGAAWSPRS